MNVDTTFVVSVFTSSSHINENEVPALMIVFILTKENIYSNLTNKLPICKSFFMGFYSELFIMNCFTTSVTKRLNSTESTKRYEIWFLKVLFQTIFKMRNKKCNSVQFKCWRLDQPRCSINPVLTYVPIL